jgi:hypothetical protein
MIRLSMIELAVPKRQVDRAELGCAGGGLGTGSSDEPCS